MSEWRNWFSKFQGIGVKKASVTNTCIQKFKSENKVESVVKPLKPKLDGGDFMTISAQVKKAKKGADTTAKEIVSNVEVSLKDIVLGIDKVGSDRSTDALVEMLSRVAVDDKAKKYWKDYFGEYGAKMTREFADILKDTKVKVGQLIKWHNWFSRNYGRSSSAAQVLYLVASNSLQSVEE